MPPVAALGVMVYGLPATDAAAGLPGLTSVTLPMVSALTSPVEVKPDSVGTVP